MLKPNTDISLVQSTVVRGQINWNVLQLWLRAESAPTSQLFIIQQHKDVSSVRPSDFSQWIYSIEFELFSISKDTIAERSWNPNEWKCVRISMKATFCWENLIIKTLRAKQQCNLIQTHRVVGSFDAFEWDVDFVRVKIRVKIYT